MNRAISVGTVDSAVGHLVGSTACFHYFWTTSFFSDTYTVRLKTVLVNRIHKAFFELKRHRVGYRKSSHHKDGGVPASGG